MDEEEAINLEEKYMAKVYAKRPIVLTRGKAVRVWDANGKEYIDFSGSYGVCIVGHSHPKVVKAIRKQAEKLISCHGSFYNDARAELLKKLVQIAPRGLNKVFLGNSGAEAVECSIKLARKFSKKPEIIAMTGAFHGKTMGALSATWNKKYREPFEPLVPGFKHVPRYNIQKIEAAITEKTAAVIVEPVQGEGGVRIPPKNFLQELREICNRKGVLLILDEIQTGLGRTGKMFACEHWGVTPDILCLAKSIAGGLPMGVTIAKEEVMSSFKVGEHTSTFGGNPLSCAAACATIDVIIEENLPQRAAKLGSYFLKNLKDFEARYKIVRGVRGLGLMIGVELRFEALNIILKSMERGVLILDAGRNVLRFLPPLIVKKKHIDKVLAVLDEALREEERERICSSAFNKPS